MGKGQAAILLIIVALVVIFLFLSPQILRPQPAIEPVKFKNDIITLENFQVSNLRPVKGSIVTVSFDVTNNGDKDVDDVIIDFGGTTIATGDDLTIVECEGEGTDAHIDVKKVFKFRRWWPFVSEKSCAFDKLVSLDARKLTVNYKVINEGSRNILVEVSYPYDGTREALIPIVDDKTVRTPRVQFSQSQPSFGPLVVDVIPPTKAWGILNQPFEVKFKLRFVGSAAVGTPIPSIDRLEIEKNNFTVALSPELLVPTTTGSTDYLSCQFKPAEVGVNRVNNTDREIKVNKEYSCNLQADVQSGEIFGYKTGTIKINYYYTFKFRKSQSITVKSVA